ncbi:MAG TPA: ABC-F family ATP-binding cassette domain-containing protein, partial [Egibacteraceae bacterium]|nr:ABC-F family ATP-binding cassette domain-containing protein [Egibacteraceae bacterium]
RHAEKLVLDAVTLGIAERDRVGVIGANGSGKSTLLRLVAGVEEPDDGRVVLGNAVRVRYLPQELTLDVEATPLQVVLAQPAGFDPVEERADAQREARARAILGRLKVADVDEAIGVRSGGQRKRIAIAAALVEPAELLILDEPTNHLDVDVIEWLENELRAWPGALLLVTHDRYLLDRVATRIVEVHRGALHTAHGSYADYLEVREVREDQAAARDRKRSSRARVELAWLRRGPKARTSKAKYRVRRAEALVASGPESGRHELAIDLPSRRIGGKVVNLHNVGKRFGERTVLQGVDHKLAPDDRIGIVGPNGSGKTTLLRLIAGQLEADEGKVVVGETVVAGVYGQDVSTLAPRTRVIDAVKEVVLETNTVEGITLSAADLLERFLFPPEAQRAYVSELSGGERRRLELLRVLATAPNLLLLDEPTNDLDLDTLAVLEEYLDQWPGALVAATHDRFFLDRVCEHLFSIEPDGSIRHHPGGWSAYREQEVRRRAERASVPAAGKEGEPPGRRTGDRPGKLRYAQRRELSFLERRIPELDQRRSALERAAQEAGGDYQLAAATGEELAEVLAELDAAETRWLELSEGKEA